MGILFQISAWAVTTVAADYTFHRYLCPKQTQAPVPVIERTVNKDPKKVIQTMAWKLASQPYSLLFDFSGLGIDRQQIFDVLHSNLSPLVTAGVKVSEDNEFLMEIMLESTSVLLLKQMRSILKHRGMKMLGSVYLKPSSTLLYDPKVVYWVVRIFNLPLDASLLLDQDQHRIKLAAAVIKSFSQSAVTVKPKNIHYETVTRLSNTIYSGTATVLVKEDVLTHSVITIQRRFIYLSCYKRQFQVDIKSLNFPRAKT